MSQFDELTPRCTLCGNTIDLLDDGFVNLRGQWMHLGQMGIDTPVFVLHPDSGMHVLQLANGQIAILPDQNQFPTKHMHKECYEQLAQERFDHDTDPDAFDNDEWYDIRR